MRGIYVVLCSSLALLGCHGKSSVEQAPQLSSTLKPVDTAQKPGFFDQYRVGGFSVGGWVNQNPGQTFKKIQPVNDQAAVVYLYRPDTKWNRQEIVASSLFINGQRIPSLLNNHYYWIELPEGTYRLSTSRPLAVQYFQKPKYMDFSVQAGQTYFIKYDEENLSTRREVSGPLIVVPERTGMDEIAFTQLKSESYNFVAQDPETGKQRSKAQKIKAPKYDASTEIQLIKPFKIWDVRTW